MSHLITQSEDTGSSPLKNLNRLKQEILNIQKVVENHSQDILQLREPLLNQIRDMKEENIALLGELKRQPSMGRNLVLEYGALAQSMHNQVDSSSRSSTAPGRSPFGGALRGSTNEWMINNRAQASKQARINTGQLRKPPNNDEVSRRGFWFSLI